MNKAALRIFLVTVIAVIIFLGMFSQFMLRPVNHDEHMYIYAGVLIQHHQLYKDFAYLQMPYLPILYDFIFRLTGNTDYIFWGRLPSLISIMLAGFLVFIIIYKKTGDIYLGLGGLVLFSFCHPVVLIMPYAWNHVIPFALALLAFFLLIEAFESKRASFIYLLLSGISTAVAIGMKLTYAVIPVPFVITMIIFPKSYSFGKRIVRSFLPYFLGMIIGLIPLIYIFINTPTDMFMFDNVGYHQANAIWRSLTGWDTGITLAGKAEFIWRELAYPSNIAVLLALLFVLLYSVRATASSKLNFKQFWEMDLVLCILTIIFLLIACLIPKPLLATYFAMPVPYVIIFAAITYSRAKVADGLPFKVFLLCLIFLSLIYGGVRFFIFLPRLPFASKWTVNQVNDISREIKQYDDVIGKNGKVATLAPLYVIEAGLPVYIQFATGSFLYRIGDLLTESEREKYVGLSEKSLAVFLEKHPPAAMLVGYEGELDEPFIDFAIKNNYREVKLKSTAGVLYLPPKPVQ